MSNKIVEVVVNLQSFTLKMNEGDAELFIKNPDHPLLKNMVRKELHYRFDNGDSFVEFLEVL